MKLRDKTWILLAILFLVKYEIEARSQQSLNETSLTPKVVNSTQNVRSSDVKSYEIEENCNKRNHYCMALGPSDDTTYCLIKPCFSLRFNDLSFCCDNMITSSEIKIFDQPMQNTQTAVKSWEEYDFKS